MLLSSIFIRSTAMQQSRGSIFIFTRVEDIVRTGKKTHRNIHRAYSLLIGMRLHVFLFLFAVTVARVIRYPLVH